MWELFYLFIKNMFILQHYFAMLDLEQLIDTGNKQIPEISGKISRTHNPKYATGWHRHLLKFISLCWVTLRSG